MTRILMFWVAVLLLFVGGSAIYLANRSGDDAAIGTVSVPDESYQHVAELTGFEFTDQLGKPFGSDELKGKVWIGSFFFADCPSICVMQNNEIAKIHRQFGEAGLMTVNITVTPDKDPPHKLWSYANRFSANHDSWKFLTGKDIDYVRQVGLDIFGLAAADETHTTEVAVFDRIGKRHGSYNVNSPEESLKLANLLQRLLDELAPVEPEDDEAMGALSDGAVESGGITDTEVGVEPPVAEQAAE